MLWCIVVQYPLFTSTRHFRDVSYVGCMKPIFMPKPLLVLVQFAAMAHIECWEQDFVRILLRDQSQTTVGL